MIPVGSGTQRVALTIFAANIDDYKKKLGEVEAYDKELADAQAENARKKQKADEAALTWLDKSIGKYKEFSEAVGGFTDAIGSVQGKLNSILGAANTVMTAVNDNARRMALESAAAGNGLDALEQASGGLVTRQKELELAAKLNTSAFALTTAQYADTAKAIRQLVREGASQEEAIQKVSEAITKLDGGPLQDFGVRTREGTTDTEKFNAVMESLHGKALKVGDGTRTSAEGMRALGVTTENSMDQIHQAITKLTAALGPFIAKAAEAVSLLFVKEDERKEMVENAGWFVRDFLGLDNDAYVHVATPEEYAKLSGVTARKDAAARTAQGIKVDPWADAASGASWSNPSDWLGLATDKANLYATKADIWKNQKPGKALDLGNLALSAEQIADGLGQVADIARSIVNFMPTDADLSARREEAATRGASATDARAQWADLEKYATADKASGAGFAFDQAAGKKASNETFLEKTFGKIEEFNAYGKAFDALTNATGAAFSALIDGSTSAGTAFKRALGEGLKGIAVSEFVMGLKAAAWSIGSFVSGDVRGGAGYALEAGKHFLAASAAGAGAALLGAGGASPGASGGGAASSQGTPGGAPSSDNGPRTLVFALGSTDPDETPRMQQQRARRRIASALGNEGYGVTYG